MFTTTVVHIDNPQALGQMRERIGIEAVEDGTQIIIEFSPDDAVATATIERLQAILDNLASAVALRQKARDRAEVGSLGAGASVEAYRG